MSNRLLRFGIALLALIAAVIVGYRIYQQEQRLVASMQTSHGTDVTAESAIATIPDIKAALHAYVAEGQGYAFWTARAGSLIEKLRAGMLELDGAAAAAGASLTQALELADRLGKSEQRARDYVRAGQRLLAGEVIFTEARDHLDAMTTQLTRTRSLLAEAGASEQAAIRREQAILGLSGAGVLAFAMLLLAVPTAAAATATTTAATLKPARNTIAEEFESSARIISRTPIAATAQPAAASANTTSAKPAARAAGSTAARPATAQVAKPAPPAQKPSVQQGAPAVYGPSGAPATPDARNDHASPPADRNTETAAPIAIAPPSLSEAATICTELARASQSVEVSNLLARAAKVLDATGAIVWMASADGRELLPAASAGYDERLLVRIGAIPRTANNVTASAIRTGTPRTSPRVGQASAALAIPLLTPLGAVGVLTAELRSAPEVDETRLAVATIFAAQLASLVGTRSVATANGSAAKANAIN
jgi:hypothetical protein